MLSQSHQADFWAVLQAFTHIGAYRLNWKLYNSNWYVPQHRERIYLVGVLAKRIRGQRQILPLSQANQSPQIESSVTHQHTIVNKQGKRKINQTYAACLTAGTKSGGNHSDMDLIIRPIITPNRLIKRQDGRRLKAVNDPAHTLTAQDRHGIAIQQSGKTNVRRYTEIECERLQGFPDNWTQYGIHEKTGKIINISPSQRYKMLGNAVTVNVVEAVIRDILNTYPNIFKTQQKVA